MGYIYIWWIVGGCVYFTVTVYYQIIYVCLCHLLILRWGSQYYSLCNTVHNAQSLLGGKLPPKKLILPYRKVLHDNDMTDIAP